MCSRRLRQHSKSEWRLCPSFYSVCEWWSATGEKTKKWVDFVKLKRAKWAPTKNSAICSKHFAAEDFLRMFTFMPGQDKPVIPRLRRDEIGISVFPKIQALGAPAEEPQTKRSRKMVRFLPLLEFTLLVFYLPYLKLETFFYLHVRLSKRRSENRKRREKIVPQQPIVSPAQVLQLRTNFSQRLEFLNKKKNNRSRRQ